MDEQRRRESDPRAAEEAGGIVTTVEGEELPCLEKSSILARNK